MPRDDPALLPSAVDATDGIITLGLLLPLAYAAAAWHARQARAARAGTTWGRETRAVIPTARSTASPPVPRARGEDLVGLMEVTRAAEEEEEAVDL